MLCDTGSPQNTKYEYLLIFKMSYLNFSGALGLPRGMYVHIILLRDISSSAPLQVDEHRMS